jgi:hypothetical protein
LGDDESGRHRVGASRDRGDREGVGVRGRVDDLEDRIGESGRDERVPYDLAGARGTADDGRGEFRPIEA